jgi:hypothetical protein
MHAAKGGWKEFTASGSGGYLMQLAAFKAAGQ